MKYAWLVFKEFLRLKWQEVGLPCVIITSLYLVGIIQVFICRNCFADNLYIRLDMFWLDYLLLPFVFGFIDICIIVLPYLFIEWIISNVKQAIKNVNKRLK